jgi:hypothetical protein
MTIPGGASLSGWAALLPLPYFWAPCRPRCKLRLISMCAFFSPPSETSTGLAQELFENELILSEELEFVASALDYVGCQPNAGYIFSLVGPTLHCRLTSAFSKVAMSFDFFSPPSHPNLRTARTSRRQTQTPRTRAACPRAVASFSSLACLPKVPHNRHRQQPPSRHQRPHQRPYR